MGFDKRWITVDLESGDRTTWQTYGEALEHVQATLPKTVGLVILAGHFNLFNQTVVYGDLASVHTETLTLRLEDRSK